MKILSIVVLGSGLLMSGAAFANHIPKGGGHADAASYAAPEGNGAINTASFAAPEGNGAIQTG